MESVLRSQFLSLIQQVSVNPESVARTLYGISVIDMNDLEIATTYVLPKQDRAKVLVVSLVRRLRRWPNLFGEVCKVLSDVPAIQEANGIIEKIIFIIRYTCAKFCLIAKFRQLLDEECSNDQFTEILERNGMYIATALAVGMSYFVHSSVDRRLGP